MEVESSGELHNILRCLQQLSCDIKVSVIHSGDKVVGTAYPTVGSCLYFTVEARAEFWLEVNENNDLIFFHLNLLAL